MGDPLFWLGLSLLLVAISLAAVLVVAIPTMRELSRAARSAEKLFDTLGRELPPTLEAIRLTGLEITELTDDVSEGVQQAGRVVKQVDDGLTSARQQAQTLHTGTRSFFAGARAAWNAWSNTGKRPPARRARSGSPKRMTHKPARIQPSRPHPRVSSPPTPSAPENSQENQENPINSVPPRGQARSAVPPSPKGHEPTPAGPAHTTDAPRVQSSPLPSDPTPPPNL